MPGFLKNVLKDSFRYISKKEASKGITKTFGDQEEMFFFFGAKSILSILQVAIDDGRTRKELTKIISLLSEETEEYRKKKVSPK